MMKKLLLLALFVFSISMAMAQSIEPLQKKMLFVYVSHDNKTSMNSLCELLRSYYDESVIYEGNVAVFYLANENEPVIVEINTPNDNRADFDKMISLLQNQNSHSVYPDSDLRTIVDIFDRLQLLAEDGITLNYETVDWFFFVTSEFWNRRYNEDLISKLCFVMGTENFDNFRFQMKFYYPEYDAFSYDEAHPFGMKNLGNMNKAFYCYPY